MSDLEVPVSFVVGTGCLTVVLASALAYVLLNTSNSKKKQALDAAKEEGEEETKKEGEEIEVDLSQFPGGALTVYFATQTGTSESFARELEREGSDHGFLVHVVDLEDVTSLASLAHKRAIFLTATYGEGESPDNATAFVELLKEKSGIEILFEQQQQGSSTDPELIDKTVLQGTDYCVFGLGNRQYDHFNAMGKFFDKSLEMTGAHRILPLGIGDDDDDLDMDFETWKDGKLWPTLKQKYNNNKSKGSSSDSATTTAKNKYPECPYVVEYHTTTNGSSKPVFDLPMDQIHSSSRHYFTAFDCPVTTVKELLRKNDEASSTVHVEIDISKAKALAGTTTTQSSSTLSYATADNLAVLPSNDSAIVERVAGCLGYDLNAVFSVRAAPNHEWHGVPFPMPCTVRECLTRYCDLTSPPRRSDLKLLASYCHEAMDQKALLRMASKEGRAEYKEKILEGYVGLVDLLKLCPSVSMPLEHFLSVCSPLQARLFTISSSNSVHPKSIHLTVDVTKHERKDGSLFKGVCSNHLANYKGTKQTASVRVFNRPSTFRLPKDSSRPILMIGPGTGIAPMRALLQERQYQKTKLKQTVGMNILYFGCKKASQDYIYEEELKSFQKSGVLDHLRVAFSREQAEKVYVQHLLKENADETWKLINDEDGHVYVCGGVKMGQDVSEALKEIVSSNGGMSMDAAKDYLAKLSSEGRFIQELWT